MEKIDNYFGITEQNSSFKIEIIAGITTFLTMAYIVLLAPDTLSVTGMDKGAVFTATCLISAISCFIMGIYAKLPVALAPGVSLLYFFAYSVCGNMDKSWEVALGCVFVSGIIFLLISLFKIREWIIDNIPHNLKKAIAAGLGGFILFIGLQKAGLIVNSEGTLVQIGDFSEYKTFMAIFCFLLIMMLQQLHITGGIVIAMLVITVGAIITGHTELPAGIVSAPPSVEPILFKMDWAAALDISMLTIVFAFLFVDLFDTAGTLITVTDRAGLVKDKKIPRLKQALISDSAATVLGSMFGVSSTTSYVESASGIAAGGRTGLVAVATGVCFLLILFFSPIAQIVPPEATAGALIYVGILMLSALGEIDWTDITEYAPALLTVFGITLSYSIADGIAIGFISYALIKCLCDKASEVSIGVWVIAGLLLLRIFLVMLA
ncbi:MAG: NCS2 family permease [Cardiobacteriaceae bacterium]|nr:NCS2 family permease [Cardiobacteriaceae bacterium]